MHFLKLGNTGNMVDIQSKVLQSLCVGRLFGDNTPNGATFSASTNGIDVEIKW